MLESRLGNNSRISFTIPDASSKDYPETISLSEEKSKAQQSAAGDDLIRRAKQRIGTDVIFVEFSDYVCAKLASMHA